eukprot:CAMPEP_0206513764 /NCGR_PEP_ID=MMETSP0324_2-20121206/61714_1 /ASSEMBLY_ACC=CAM_ASM_000836 /TAXON_ID=2866 /ORGANISM="Crypthecodinium cohnii, Strain Seligo" /LENGTH=409 /DNA_ID=CAMNT_0054006065 /DNA_START=70 /DNA_END=1299 /DNA_ORIENTATION=-
MSNPQFGIAAAPPNTNIYVAGLPHGIDDNKLREIFAAYGEVVWCKVMKEGRDGRIPAIVEFSNLEHATWVVANVNGGIPQGLTEPVDVKFKDEKHHGGWGYEKGYGKGGPRFSAGGAGGAGGGYSVPPPGGGKGSGCVVPPPAGGKPPSDPVPSDNVYIKGLPLNADDVLLKQVFSAFGNVTQCRVCTNTEARAQTGSYTDRKTALVRFGSIEEAATCIQACNSGEPPAGLTEPVEVRFADTWDTKQKRNSDGTEYSIDVIVKGFESSGLMPGGQGGRYDSNTNCALYIAGLPSDTTDYHLFKLFSPLGPIAPRGVRALLNEDGTCKGIAFVNFQREDSVHAAISVYNGAALPDGSRLKVQQKAPKPQPHVLQPPVEPAKVIPPPAGGQPQVPNMAPPSGDPTGAEAAG